MKKLPYEKPSVYVEELMLDRPIATNCFDGPNEAAYKADMEYLLSRNYFGSGDGCSRPFVDGESHDTICYHSYTVFAFTS